MKAVLYSKYWTKIENKGVIPSLMSETHQSQTQLDLLWIMATSLSSYDSGPSHHSRICELMAEGKSGLLLDMMHEWVA